MARRKSVRRVLPAGILVLLGLAVGAVWLLPGLLDWNRYRDTIAGLASAELGRTVRIEGPITLTLLPQTVLTAARVEVADAGDGVTMTARALRLQVALGPLLAGRIDPRDLVLRRPVIRLPWPIPPEALVRRPAWLGALSARIEDGQLLVGTLRFTGINALLSAHDGGYAAAGSAAVSGRPWRFTARLIGAGPDGAGLDASLDGIGPTRGIGASFSGRLAADGTLAGHVVARGPDLSQLLPAPPVPFRAQGRLTLASGLAAADNLALEIGGSPARGAVALRVTPSPRLDLALAGSRLDLDAWLPVLLRGSTFPYPVGLDLSAEAVQLGGGLLRKLRAAFDFAQGVVDVRDATAVLPGDATLSLTGRISRSVPTASSAARKPHFDGTLKLQAPDLRTTLHWLDAAGLQPLETLPSDVLRSADLSATAFVDPGRIALIGLSGQADGSPVSGTLSLGLGPRLAVAGNLVLDRLDLDSWLPADMPRLPTGMPDLAAIPRLFRPFDVDLELQVRKTAVRGVVVDGLSLSAEAAGGGLTIRRLAGTVQDRADGHAGGGVRIDLSGSIGEDGRIGDGRLDLNAEGVRPLAAPVLLSWLPPSWQSTTSLWPGPAHLQVEAAGPAKALGLRVRLELGDARLEATPTLDLPAGTWSGPLTLRHPGAPRLLLALGLPDPYGWIGDGSLSLVSQLAGTRNQLRADGFDLTAGALHATGRLALDISGVLPGLTGTVRAETLPLPRLRFRSSDPLPFAALRGWRGSLRIEAAQVLIGLVPSLRQASATLSVDDGQLRVDGLTARLGDGALTGTARLDARAEPPSLTVQAKLLGASFGGPVFDLPLDIQAGVLDGSADLHATGYSPATLVTTLGGSLHIAARSGAITGFNLSELRDDLRQSAEDSAVVASLDGGTSGFDRLELAGTLAQGVLTFDQAYLTGSDGTAALSGSIDLSGAALDLHAVMHPAVPDAPQVGLALIGPFTAPQRTPELADVARWRARERASP